MTASRSALERLALFRGELGRIPRLSDGHSCERCLGPVGAGYRTCVPCNRLFSTAPAELRGASISITTAVAPSPWYSRLIAYKTVFKDENGLNLAALLSVFYSEHEGRFTTQLGGAPTLVAVVPSKRGRAFEHQPLRKAVSAIMALREKVQDVIRYVPRQSSARQQFTPEVFQCPRDLVGERILLIEDTWTSGATAVSAAGALLNAGAEAVGIVAIARKVDAEFWTAEHPYIVEARKSWDVRTWPRD